MMFFYFLFIHAASTDKKTEEEIKREICSQKPAQPPSDQTTQTTEKGMRSWRAEKSIGEVAADISAHEKAIEQAIEKKRW